MGDSNTQTFLEFVFWLLKTAPWVAVILYGMTGLFSLTILSIMLKYITIMVCGVNDKNDEES